MSGRRAQLKGRSDKAGRHVRLYHYLLKSAAWQSLSANARCVYIEMATRYAGDGSNNGRLPYAVRDAVKSLRIGKSTAGRALDELQDRGFIVPVLKGAFSLKTKHATEWRLTEFPCDVTHALPSKDFMRWPEIQKPVPVTGLTVPDMAPTGTHNGTVVPFNRQTGT